MILKREISEKGCFGKGVWGDDWNFHFYNGDFYKATNKRLIPINTNRIIGLKERFLKVEIRTSKVSSLVNDPDRIFDNI
jgi:hypothetical protein